ncbi:MCE family protein [Mycobacterium sp.]|uniref:MCE family protein n=1 Tax=Mycobacterium sp. TaxID=1785 RepID=UPI002D0FBA57|nr:MCE family protein [Mycobacterium sp.]HKP41516.1 MCE family protein [Mycobacterium sp.]
MRRIALSGLLIRVVTFVVVCAAGLFGLLAVFAQLRFSNDVSYNALFSDVSGLEAGNFVRIAGVEVGKVQRVKVKDDNTVLVAFGVDPSVVLTNGTKAAIRYDNLIGGRYLALEEGAGGVAKMTAGQTIPADRTAPALDLDALIGGFRPLFRALDPEQVNALSGQLIAAFQGQGPTIGSVLTQLAAFTSTLADRDELIGQVVLNLDAVLGSLGERSEKFGTAVDSLSQLVQALSQRKEDVTNGLGYASEASGTIADLLADVRPPLQKVVHETDRTAATVLADHDYFDNLLATLPDAYRILGRQGLAGDFFNFYLCDLVLKVNGKGGQPVYVKIAGQSSGRCTPR